MSGLAAMAAKAMFVQAALSTTAVMAAYRWVCYTDFMFSFSCGTQSQLLTLSDPLTIAGFTAILSYSFFVSAHCTLMCGPILGAQLARRPKEFAQNAVLYNCGRTISYTLLGALLGSLGMGFSCLFAPFKKYIALAAGILLILVAAKFFFADLRKFNLFSPAQSKLSRVITKRLAAVPYRWQSFLLGLVTVLLPCVTLSPALLTATASGSTLTGAILMLAFALGTWPAMLATAFFPGLWAKFVNGRTPRLLAGAFLLLVAVIFIYRALQN